MQNTYLECNKSYTKCVKYYLVCPVGVIAGKQDGLTYSAEKEFKVGDIVNIPFGKTSRIGVVLSGVPRPKFATKPIASSIADTFLPDHLLSLAQWISQYYATRLPFVLQSVLPSGISKTRRSITKDEVKTIRDSSIPNLTKDQQDVLRDIRSSNQTTHILHGVTGSGKTRVYQELATDTIKMNQSVIILVPEIALTPQLSSEFQQLHKNVMVLHSRLTESQKHQNWMTLLSSSEPWILVGPRSTIFYPLGNLGLIVIDEAHEPSYQQDSQPQYSALRVARKLADLSKHNAKLILGSATPLVSDYYYAIETKTPIHRLSEQTKARETEVEIVDFTDKPAFGTHSLFSKSLIEAMNNAVTQNEQILLFHNRRGTARMCLCSICGWSASCANCYVPLRLHQDKNTLLCHTCGLRTNLPKTCPECSSVDIDFKGFGSKRIETEIQKLFPNLSVARFDSDTELKLQLQNRYQDLYDNKIQIIVGTQGIAKGLDLPNLSTVGIIQADTELFIPDFSSSERAFQLITQVIGRAGRQGQPSKIVIQTLNPDHPVIKFGASQDYAGFYNFELAERKSEHMPPFVFILQLSVGYASVASAQKEAQRLTDFIKKAYPKISIRGPAPAFHDHKGSKFFQQLVVASPSRSNLVEIASNLPPRWRFTLDPINLL